MSIFSFGNGKLRAVQKHLSTATATVVIPQQANAWISQIVLSDISGSGDTVEIDLYDGSSAFIIHKVANVPANGVLKLDFDQLGINAQSLRATAANAGRINVMANYIMG